MTQPLPNPSTKTAPAASSRLDIGNFFQPAPTRKDSSSFESVLDRSVTEDSRQHFSADSKPQKLKKPMPLENPAANAEPSRTQSQESLGGRACLYGKINSSQAGDKSEAQPAVDDFSESNPDPAIAESNFAKLTEGTNASEDVSIEKKESIGEETINYENAAQEPSSFINGLPPQAYRQAAQIPLSIVSASVSSETSPETSALLAAETAEPNPPALAVTSTQLIRMQNPDVNHQVQPPLSGPVSTPNEKDSPNLIGGDEILLTQPDLSEETPIDENNRIYPDFSRPAGKSPKDLSSAPVEHLKSTKQSEIPRDPSSGTGNASTSSEMISFPTEAMDASSLTPADVGTSSNQMRSHTPVADRLGQIIITDAISGLESSSGNGANGNPNHTNHSTLSQNPSPSSTPSLLAKALSMEVEKLRQSGESQVQLDVPINDSESVKIKLAMRAGELRTTFITESPELREALQKSWTEFAQNTRDRGYRFSDPSFQNSYSQNESASQGRQQNTDRETAERHQPSQATISTNTRKPNTSAVSAKDRSALWA